MSFRKETVQAALLQLNPSTPPRQGLSTAPTNGGLYYDETANQFFGIVNGQVAPLGGAVVFAGTPTGSCQPNQIAINSGTGALYSCSSGSWVQVGPTAGSLVSPVTSPNPLAFDVNLALKGPIPHSDVTRYGVRSVNTSIAPAAPGITATINSTSASAALSSASTFQNGDGVVIFGAGASHSMTTPTGLTVTPSVAAFGTGTGIVVNGPAGGATTYNYQIVARNKQGGLTAASTVATTAAGASALGAQSVVISGFTRSGSTVTATTSSAHGLSVGSMVYIFAAVNGADNLNFGGWYVVSTVADNTHFTYVTGQDVAAGALSVSAGGGTANWFNCNHLSWSPVTGAFEYYIYGRTGGSLTLLGVSKVQSTVNGLTLDTTWDDFGSPMMDGILLPFLAPSTPPVSATSNSLVTTISSGAGTTTLTLANSAGTSVSGATILFDNAPNIATAAAACVNNSLVYFPNGTFVVNSYLTIPSGVTLNLAGATLTLNDTMELTSGVKILGMIGAQASSSLAFGTPVGAFISVNRANPGIYGSFGDFFFSGFQTTASGNCSIAMTLDNPAYSVFQDINFADGGSGYMGMPIIVRNMDFFLSFERVAVVCGPGQVNGACATPAMFFSGMGSLSFRKLSMNRRGIYFIPNPAGANCTFYPISRLQGGITPFFNTYFSAGGNVGGTYEFRDVELDTMNHALIANLSGTNTNANVIITGGSGPSGSFGYVTGKPMGIIDGASVTNAGQNINLKQIINTLTFATLGTPSNGTFAFCPDCTIANPCAGSGTGALAKRLNGVWVCN